MRPSPDPTSPPSPDPRAPAAADSLPDGHTRGAPRCARCRTLACAEGRDCLGHGDDDRLYDERARTLHRAAAAIEARHYGEAPRLREVALFAREIGARRIGLAFCVGLAEEARAVEQVLARDFDVVSVCCKLGGVAKERLGLERVHPEAPHESMCNPLGQAEALNAAGSDLNVLIGLCVGHDALFTKRSAAPATTLIAKDRVLAHNPAAAVYCRYARRRLGG